MEGSPLSQASSQETSQEAPQLARGVGQEIALEQPKKKSLFGVLSRMLEDRPQTPVVPEASKIDTLEVLKTSPSVSEEGVSASISSSEILPPPENGAPLETNPETKTETATSLTEAPSRELASPSETLPEIPQETFAPLAESTPLVTTEVMQSAPSVVGSEVSFFGRRQNDMKSGEGVASLAAAPSAEVETSSSEVVVPSQDTPESLTPQELPVADIESILSNTVEVVEEQGVGSSEVKDVSLEIAHPEQEASLVSTEAPAELPVQPEAVLSRPVVEEVSTSSEVQSKSSLLRTKLTPFVHSSSRIPKRNLSPLGSLPQEVAQESSQEVKASMETAPSKSPRVKRSSLWGNTMRALVASAAVLGGAQGAQAQMYGQVYGGVQQMSASQGARLIVGAAILGGVIRAMQPAPQPQQARVERVGTEVRFSPEAEGFLQSNGFLINRSPFYIADANNLRDQIKVDPKILRVDVFMKPENPNVAYVDAYQWAGMGGAQYVQKVQYIIGRNPQGKMSASQLGDAVNVGR